MRPIVSSPPFTFRLERVRALRERAEEQAKEEYAASLAHRLDGVALLRAAAAERGRAGARSPRGRGRGAPHGARAGGPRTPRARAPAREAPGRPRARERAPRER